MTLSLPAVLTRSLSRGTDMVRSTLGSLTWGPALAVARPAVLFVFASIETGTLLLVDEVSGARYVFGQNLGGSSKLQDTVEYNFDDATNGVASIRTATTVPRVELVVKNDAFWMRLFLFADMGFAESYLLGEFECKDLTAFFRVSATQNEVVEGRMPS